MMREFEAPARRAMVTRKTTTKVEAPKVDDDAAAREVVLRVMTSTTEAEREALLYWLLGLLQIRASKASVVQKSRQALAHTKRSQVAFPLIKMLAAEASSAAAKLKQVGWTDRSLKGKAAVLAGGAGFVAFGGQGAGIAALGTAVGLPLWIVLGAGAYFGVRVVELLIDSLPVHRRPRFDAGNLDVIDVLDVKVILDKDGHVLIDSDSSLR